jgi:hypothetical protein
MRGAQRYSRWHQMIGWQVTLAPPALPGHCRLDNFAVRYENAARPRDEGGSATNWLHSTYSSGRTRLFSAAPLKRSAIDPTVCQINARARIAY